VSASTPASVSPVGLLERDGDRAALRGAAEPAALVIVEGPAGVGKTELIGVGARWAAQQGVRVLDARGVELEREFPYGLIRQLLAPALAALQPAERAKLLEGPAVPAGPVLGGAADRLGAERPARDHAWAVREALSAVCGRLARRGPLLLAVDDAHWADLASLRCLAFLARHRRELALALLVATRPAERPQEADLMLELLGDPEALILRPAPLSTDAVATLLAAELGTEPEPEFASACQRATGGTPLYVLALARELAERDLAPVAANAELAASIGPRTLAATLLARVRRVAPAGADAARAVAVLGPEARPHRVARLAGVSAAAATEAADALAAAGVLRPGRPLDFVHPVLRATIADDLPAGERSRLHAAAARLLRQEGAPVDRVATHLLASDPAGDADTVELLSTAARGALGQGAPSSAVSYLRRALAEPPPASRRPQLLLELGFAESYAGMAETFEHLEHALELAQDAAARSSTAMALGRMLEIAGRAPDAYTVLDRAAREARAHDPERAVALEAAAVNAGILYEDTAGAAATRARDLRRRLAAAPESVPASVAGTLAYAAAIAGEPADDVVALARHALEAHPRVLPEAPDRPPFYYHACAALMFCERYDEEARLLDASLEQARRLSARSHLVLLSIFRAWLNARRGALMAVDDDAALAFAEPPAPRFSRLLALAARLEALVERDELDRGAREVEADWIGDDGSVMHAVFLAARARLRSAQQRPAEALADALWAGRQLVALQAPSPAVAPWRSTVAIAHHALGDATAARALVQEEAKLARAAGLPRAIGIAQRAAGVIEGGERDIELLAEAATTLAGTEAPVERARALADLGVALRRRGRRAQARDVLAQALDVAHRHHAHRIAEHARRELRAAGARPRRALLTGVEALTPSERRVAEFAAQGLTNAEIARQLFVAPRTVEGHLTHVYRKLDISRRTELADALHPSPPEKPKG
jgi:DNA-binding CsgD family transcriptional regulator